MHTHLKFRITHLLLFFLLSVACVAQKQVPELWGQRVHDDAQVLKPETVDALEKQLKVYEDSTSNQIAILIVQSLDGDVLEEYSIRVVEKWKLGTKEKDNGVLLLIVVDDHKMRIEVGHGLEGVLTDAQSNRIIRNEIAPNFRRGDYDAGVLAGIDGIIRSIGGEYKADDVEEFSSSDRPSGSILGNIFIYFVLGLLLIMAITFALAALFNTGCASWVFFAFILLIASLLPFNMLGPTAAGIFLVLSLVSKFFINRSPWGKRMANHGR